MKGEARRAKILGHAPNTLPGHIFWRDRQGRYMTTIDEITDNFLLLDDWDDRYRYVIELGRTLAPIGEDAKAMIFGGNARALLRL